MKDKKETQNLVQTLQAVAEKKYKVGDEVKAYGKNCKIVEVLEDGRFHVKNLESPFDSFVVLVTEFE